MRGDPGKKPPLDFESEKRSSPYAISCHRRPDNFLISRFASRFSFPEICSKIRWRENRRRAKIFDFEIFCVEEYQRGERGTKFSPHPAKFRVSPRYDHFDTAACHGVYHTILSAGVQLLFCGAYFGAAAHVLMGEGGRLWRSGC